MSTFDRLRARRHAKRAARAIERAWQKAPTQSMRDEIEFIAQRRLY